MGNISSVLKAKRKELGLTLAQIAEKIWSLDKEAYPQSASLEM